MEFGISKCVHVTMKAGTLVSAGGMKLLSGKVISEIESDKGYKYLGMQRLRQLISSKLNGGNTTPGRYP